MFNSEELETKWADILESADAPAFKDHNRKSVTAVLLENQEKALQETNAQASYLSEETPSNVAANGGAWDPILISLVRRSMPNLIAFDVAGVQPMNGPTGTVFAMKSRYNNKDAGGALNRDGAWAGKVDRDDSEALFDAPDTQWSGDPAGVDRTGQSWDPTAAGGAGDWVNSIIAGAEIPQGSMATGIAEGDIDREMGFTVDSMTVTAKSRQLRAEYSLELAQDLKQIHGADAEAELANILSTEILSEINREMINNIRYSALLGGKVDTTGATGSFDLDNDTDGRYAAEKFRGLLFQIEMECNAIAIQTRRGKGNFIICSSNVASALAAAGVLSYVPAIQADLQVDATGNTFAGTINNAIKVYVDPFATDEFVTVGYRGQTSYDAGIFYCPYVPLTMLKAQDGPSFQPRIAFKTRYGVAANPFVGAGDGKITYLSNPYYRTFKVTGLNG